MDLRVLTDETLLARLHGLVNQERESSGDVIEHLAEADRRDVVLDRGYPSLFQYCVKELRYSEAAAFLRIRAARATNRYPRILDELRSGALHLDAIARLYPHLTAENCESLLGRAAGARKKDVLALVASFETGRPERDLIRPLPPAPTAALPSPPPRAVEADAARSAAGPFEPDAARPASEPFEPAVVPPPARVRFAFTADDELVVMVDRLRGHLRHRHPQGRLEDLFKTAARSLLERLENTKTPRASRSRPSAGSRYIPVAVKAAVRARDAGRCAFVSADGRRCGSRDALEFDHVRPWALGGPSDSVENIRLLCRPHNQRLARKRFGPRPRKPPGAAR